MICGLVIWPRQVWVDMGYENGPRRAHLSCDKLGSAKTLENLNARRIAAIRRVNGKEV